MPFEASKIKRRAPQWFVPEDPNQPFLDFLFLIPEPEQSTWEVRVVQNTISTKHSADLEQLKRVLMGIEASGFVLACTVTVCYVIERKEQATTLGSDIHTKTIEVPSDWNQAPAVSLRSKGEKASKSFTVNVSHALFQRTATAP